MATKPVMASKVRPIPEGFRTVTPYLCVKDGAGAMEFYRKAFGATEALRLPMPDGRIGHAEVRIGDSFIMLSDEFPEYGNRSPESIGGSPVIIHLYVEDVDAMASQAVAAGAKVLSAVADWEHGDRSGRLADPFGHLWIVSTHKKGKYMPEGYHTATPYLIASDASRALEFYKQAFGARELMRMAMPDGRIGHAEVQIGDSRIMLADENIMGDAVTKSPTALGGSTAGLALYVPDVDALFKRAVEAGAKTKRPLENQFYGDRSATIEDPFGHVWTLATHVEDVSAEEMKKRMAALPKG